MVAGSVTHHPRPLLNRGGESFSWESKFISAKVRKNSRLSGSKLASLLPSFIANSSTHASSARPRENENHLLREVETVPFETAN